MTRVIEKLRCSHGSGVQLANLRVQPTLIDRIKTAQMNNPQLQKIRQVMESRAQSEFKSHDDGSLKFENRSCS